MGAWVTWTSEVPIALMAGTGEARHGCSHDRGET